ncbi:DMT family transporter [Neolewinella antarctica]|uniref:Drug/metabolite transporter (DMT)-like permease n=1 Tax=Neolewinella antarctica TaxID=442734 RepID=A0ABX0X9C4_9BACT|nr:DMT family transporter [Neolewinella antarctica]NJC25382.1 drug/metabolite transporter (DMT)-like permease [Neolewinella antarctica]
MSRPSVSPLLQLNVAMVFVGTSGVLGRFVPVPAPVAIWWRASIAAALLIAFCLFKGYSFKLRNNKQTKTILLSAVLMTAHWITYFYALKLSSVAIGMLAIFTYPAMTTLLEPLVLKKPFVPRHLLLGVLVIYGVYLLAPSFDLADGATLGLALGLLSALIYALRNLTVKKEIADVQGSVVMVYQTVIASIILLPIWWLFEAVPTAEAMPYLLGLGLLTTAIGHTLFLACFRFFSVSTVSLLSCIQPIYGILLGVIFFEEIPEWSAVGGGALILAAVAIESVAVGRKVS